MRDKPSQQVAIRIEGVHKAMPLAGDVIVAGGIAHGERDIENAAKVLDVEGRVVGRDFRIGEGAGWTEVAVEDVDRAAPEVGRVEPVTGCGGADRQTLVDRARRRQRVIDLRPGDDPEGRLAGASAGANG